MFSTDDYLVPTWSAAPTAPSLYFYSYAVSKSSAMAPTMGNCLSR